MEGIWRDKTVGKEVKQLKQPENKDTINTEVKALQKVIETKELKIRPGTGEHDYQVKIRNAQKFLKEGNRVKFSLRFKGREMEHSNLGINMLKRVKTDLEELIRVEMEPKIEGRQAFLVVAPK